MEGLSQRTGKESSEQVFEEHLQAYLQSLTMDKEGKHETLYAQYASEILKNGYKLRAETEKRFEIIGGLSRYDGKRITKEITESPDFTCDNYTQLEEYLQELTTLEKAGKSYGKVASEFWQELLKKDDNAIQRVEEKFQKLKGILSQEETRLLGKTINRQMRSLPEDTRDQIILTMMSTKTGDAGDYYQEFLTSLKEKP